MALGLKFIGVAHHHGEYTIERIPGEVGCGFEYLQDQRFREITSTPGFYDSYAILTPEEALAIAKPHYEKLADLWRTTGEHSKADAQLEMMEAGLRKANIVIAHVFDWESGF